MVVSEYSRLGQEMAPMPPELGPAGPKPVTAATTDIPGLTVGFLIGAVVGGFIGAIAKGVTSKYAPLNVRYR